MTEVDSNETLPGEEVIFELQTKIRETFPAYTEMDRTEYDAYDPNNDPLSRGQILWFFTEKGKDQRENPSIYVIFRPDGFVINKINSPQPLERPSLQSQNDSVFGHHHGNAQRRWQPDEVEQAVEKMKIRAEGVNLDEEFKNQLAGWSEEEQRFITMGERMETHKKQMGEVRAIKAKSRKAFLAKRLLYIWELYEQNPQKAAELAMVRIGEGQVCNEIRQGTPAGKKAMLRELNIIEAYESLLKDRFFL